MPIILTDQILAATEQPDAGWSLAEFATYTEKPNKDNSGVDYTFVFEILQGPGDSMVNKGRRAFCNIYGKALAAGVAEECNKFKEFLLVITDSTSVDEIRNQEIDLTQFYGKRLWVYVKDEPYEGRILKKVVQFSPDEVVPF